MRVLVLGITGMLGHAVWENLRQRFITLGTTRKNWSSLRECSFFSKDFDDVVFEVDALKDDDLRRAMNPKPDVVVNCVGVVKQHEDAKDMARLIATNALLPHRLASACKKIGARLIHVSTDCVFTGSMGGYTERDFPDAADGYGKTKILGEMDLALALTLRTSIVGRELAGARGLFEWFLSQEEEIEGYRRVYFSGLTTYALAEIIGTLIERQPRLSGLYNVSSEPISKYDLLYMVKTAVGRKILIIPKSDPNNDRTLDSTKFREETGILIPTWDKMIGQFAKIVPFYEEWRLKNGA